MSEKPSILLVDDERNVLKSCQRLLHRAGYQSELANSGAEALEKLKYNTFAAIVSDQRMPEMEGTELLAEVAKQYPETVRIMLTGYADIQASIAAINKGSVWRYLTKPWDDEDYVTCVKQALDHYKMVREHQELQELTHSQNLELQTLNAELEHKVEERTSQITALNGSLRTSLMGVIRILADIGERHNSVIGSHSRRVTSISMKLGKQLGLEDSVLSQLHIAAMLHDVGKIGMPARLLQVSPNLLTGVDREEYKTHCLAGAKLIEMIPNFSRAASFIKSHHEKLNGTGYPEKLHGEDIPIGSQIIAVANHYDHSLNDSHKYEHVTIDVALQDVIKHAGTWYRKDVVDALVQLVETGEHEIIQLAHYVDIKINQLKPGMTLATDVHLNGGAMILKAGHKLSEQQIQALNKFLEREMLLGEVSISREVKGELVTT